MSARGLSLGRLAVFSLGAAALVLVAATALVWIIKPSQGVALTIVLLGLVGSVAAMGFVSRRMVARAIESDAEDEKRRP
ncbi:hypothetical protein P0W64_01310 [Tsukamurella sp. 8F]|uniref:hypothetical protein n=1 Tax=unclassified Tsukamurella TaxID=2633480 RepID=UPI0023B93291|nr:MULTISPECIES: hypothetical protein [unclassified Tsukamurella]MDF0529223.1 hypothetical protein [Tsukamurella sp. 8J]MDF0585408.1 hypothetical protein [Tsukamurella sp. 8F]